MKKNIITAIVLIFGLIIISGATDIISDQHSDSIAAIMSVNETVQRKTTLATSAEDINTAPTMTPIPTPSTAPVVVNPFIYSTNGDSAILTGCISKTRNTASIPDTITYEGKEYKVEAIGPKAFANQEYLYEVKGHAALRLNL